jgi:hypothetical protein
MPLFGNLIEKSATDEDENGDDDAFLIPILSAIMSLPIR